MPAEVVTLAEVRAERRIPKDAEVGDWTISIRDGLVIFETDGVEIFFTPESARDAGFAFIQAALKARRQG